MLVIDDLHLAHGAQPVVNGLDLALAPGQVTAIFGPNGAGKSTLLRGLFGDHPARRGGLALDGTSFHAASRRAWQDRFGYMPQDSHPCVGLTALEVVLLGSIEHLSLRVTQAALREAALGLDRLGMLPLAQRRIETLSGGQRQLVFFAQALMRRPRVLLLDEPVSALDLRHQMLLLKRVRETTAAHDLITVVVLHDLNLAAAFADRVVLLHQGNALADGPPQAVFSSALLRTVYGIETKVGTDDAGRPWIQVLNANEDHHEIA